MPVSHRKVVKLVLILKRFIVALNENKHISVHNHINQFYYMTKVEELEFLLNKYNRDPAARSIAQTMIDTKYYEAFINWRNDVTWFSKFIRAEKNESRAINVAQEPTQTS